jgi:hypothetical protein
VFPFDGTKDVIIAIHTDVGKDFFMVAETKAIADEWYALSPRPPPPPPPPTSPKPFHTLAPCVAGVSTGWHVPAPGFWVGECVEVMIAQPLWAVDDLGPGEVHGSW